MEPLHFQHWYNMKFDYFEGFFFNNICKSQFDYNFIYQNENDQNDIEDSIILRVETSRNTNDILFDGSSLDLPDNSLTIQSIDPIMQQQHNEEEEGQSVQQQQQQQEYVLDNIDMDDLGGMEDYGDMMDYDQ